MIRAKKRRPFFLQVLLLLPLLAPSVRAINWLGIHRLGREARTPDDLDATPFTYAECSYARNSLGLSRGPQFRFCRGEKTRHAMHFVFRAALAALHLCPEAFAQRRWNCSSVAMLPNLSPELARGTRERAIVHAFASAAFTYEVAHHCALGKIRNCACAPNPPPSFDMNGAEAFDGRSANTALSWDPRLAERAFGAKANELYGWGGCGDNLQQAKAYANMFLGVNFGPGELDDSFMRLTRQAYAYRRPVRGRRPRAYNNGYGPRLRRPRRRLQQPTVTLGHPLRNQRRIARLLAQHNYKSGIQLMEDQQRRVCKCHGTSGSCTWKHCTKQLRRPDDALVLEQLRQLYMSARMLVKVEANQLIGRMLRGEKFVDEPISANAIVIDEDSPDFCDPDPLRGSPGTRDRQCSLEAGLDDNFHCNVMCCGRGFWNSTRQESKNCNCHLAKNRIKCSQCTYMITEHFCR